MSKNTTTFGDEVAVRWVYRWTTGGVYTVGYYAPNSGEWYAESDHDIADEAAARVHYLNSGVVAG